MVLLPLATLSDLCKGVLAQTSFLAAIVGGEEAKEVDETVEGVERGRYRVFGSKGLSGRLPDMVPFDPYVLFAGAKGLRLAGAIAVWAILF